MRYTYIVLSANIGLLYICDNFEELLGKVKFIIYNTNTKFKNIIDETELMSSLKIEHEEYVKTQKREEDVLFIPSFFFK